MLRRNFIKNSILSVPLVSSLPLCGTNVEPIKIGLAQWSLHRALQSNKIDNLEFAQIAKEKFDITVVEYVNQFFFDKATNKEYLSELKARSKDIGVKNLLIMIDDEGNLGDLNKRKRLKAIDNHKKWVEAAQSIGCEHIRVNAAGNGSEKEVSMNAIESLQVLGDFSKNFDINIIVENHGGYSSNAKWLVDIIKNSNRDNIGTLPDFGNFRIEGDEWYDRYQGMEELMPYAKAVSAKSHEFDNNGNEVHSDYYQMMEIVFKSNYHGYVGIEYEGNKHSEIDGIRLTRDLLIKVRNS